MRQSETLRHQARTAETRARKATLGAERIQLAAEAKSLHGQADKAEHVEAAGDAERGQNGAPRGI